MPRALRQSKKVKFPLRAESQDPAVLALPTEQANPASTEIDALDTVGILQTIHAQDAAVPAAVVAEIPVIAKAVEAVVRALQRGGRLIYVGAGTSGRLGVMDATSIAMCRDNQLPIVVFNLNRKGNIMRMSMGEPVGTLIH